MKKALPVLLLASVAFQSKAQEFQKGQKLLGGSLSFEAKNLKVVDEKSSGTNLIFSPSLGFVQNKNTILGFSLDYGLNYAKADGSSTSLGSKWNTHTVGANGFIQKLKWLNDKWFLFVQGNVGGSYGIGNSYALPDDFKTISSKSWLISANVVPGISYRIVPKLLLDFRLNNLLAINYYQSTSTAYSPVNQNKTKSNGFELRSSLNNNVLSNIGIGMRWVLN